MFLRVAFLGFSEFERETLASAFRLTPHRSPRYEPVLMLTDADFLVADADHAPSVQLVAATERMDETVFIGAEPPPGATAWMPRPIDPLHVLRELDAMVALAASFTETRPPGEDPLPLHLTLKLPPQPLDVAPRQALARAPLRAEASAPEAPRSAGSAGSARSAAPAAQAAAAAPPAPPRASAAEARPATQSLLMRTPPPVAPPAPPRALLIDDSEIALRFLQSRLRPWRLQVDCASSSGKALELLAQQSYEFAFLDVELGPDSELDGLRLCQHIKQSPFAVGTLVILVSAHHSELDRVRGALAGCDAYLGKPLDSRELARLLQRQGLREPASTPASAGAAPT